MKIFILIFSLFAFSLVKGQESILFKSKGFPNKTYTSKMSQRMTSDGKLESSFSSPIKIDVTSSNTKLEAEIEMELVMKTGNDRGGCIPFLSKIIKSQSLQKYNGEVSKVDSFMQGSTIYGCFDIQTNQKKIDSISNTKLDSMENFALKKRLERVNNLFPSRPIVIGESFKKDSVQVFPILAADEQEFVVTTEYTLKKIEKGIAFLESKLFFRLKNVNKQIEIVPSTSGAGSVEWDIENHCITDEQTEYTIDVRVLAKKGIIVSSKIWNRSNTHVNIE